MFGVVDGIVVSTAKEVGEPVGLAADVTGIYILVGNERFALSKRSLSDGALIDTFGDQGIIDTTVDGAAPTALALHEGTLLVALTHRLTDSDSEWRSKAFDRLDGRHITGFGMRGVMSRNVSDRDDVPNSNTADATGVYVDGRIHSSTSKFWSSEVLVEKYFRGD
jgi:hypothetical protein